MMERDLKAQNDAISGNIRKFGWHCLHVFPTQEGQDKFTYSIGFSESYGAPEILVFGASREKAHALLNECANLLKNGHTIRPGEEDSNVLAGGYSVVFRRIRPEHFGEYLGTALRYYQDVSFDAVVMFPPDRNHLFPWDHGYDYIPADEFLAIV